MNARLHARKLFLHLLHLLHLPVGLHCTICVCVFSAIAGAQDDIKRVTEMAQRAVTVFGMSPAIGNVSFPTKEEIGIGTKPYSDKLAGDIDRVSRLD